MVNMNTIKTWKGMLDYELLKNGESWDDVEENTMTDNDMYREFESSFKQHAQGAPFTVWTKNRIYFPCCYDGSEWVGSVSRNLDGKATKHIGGG